ncbi:MAG: T9SS type A sorting domain-containing protein [Candidatus Zixiibacteriota bacterium]|nr:MAG: T9SS type A sorting domain-containing protein [candidate division Zixibacteria bacterium]
MKKILFTALILSLGSISSATVINVPADYPTIQQGIDASTDGDTVLVQPGAYVENINFNGHNIVLGSLFLTTGDTSYISQTVIDGNLLGSVVKFENEEDSTAIITGFTVTNGHSLTGGGIYCFGSSPKISRNIIRENNAVNKGGGIVCFQSSPFIYYNIINDNNITGAGKGGGIYCNQSEVLIRRNIIGGNSATISGGGLSSISNSVISVDSNTIENNTASLGGGLDSYHTTLIINNNIFRNNSATIVGGAVKCFNSETIFDNNVLIGNEASDGGAICFDSLNATISNNTFVDNIASGGYGDGGAFSGSGFSSSYIIKYNIFVNNSATYKGGAVYCGGNFVDIYGNVFNADSAGYGGGAIRISYTDMAKINRNIIIDSYAGSLGGGIILTHNNNEFIENNIICGNFAEIGGGLAFFHSENLYIKNNTISGNEAFLYGGGIYLSHSDLSISNSILWADIGGQGEPEIAVHNFSSVIASYCDIQDGWPGVGNIDVNPFFREPENGDFHLMAIVCGDSADSPCIDAGHPDSLDIVLGCLYGLGGPRSDMGAYGGNNGDWTTGICDDFISENKNPPQDFFIEQNYPNPFNASTTIRFTLPEPQNAKLTVYDLLGRQVKTLLDEYRQAGIHAVTFEAAHLSSGVYFYRLQAGEKIETKRMLLLK